MGLSWLRKGQGFPERIVAGSPDTLKRVVASMDEGNQETHGFSRSLHGYSVERI